MWYVFQHKEKAFIELQSCVLYWAFIGFFCFSHFFFSFFCFFLLCVCGEGGGEVGGEFETKDMSILIQIQRCRQGSNKKNSPNWIPEITLFSFGLRTEYLRQKESYNRTNCWTDMFVRKLVKHIYCFQNLLWKRYNSFPNLQIT